MCFCSFHRENESTFGKRFFKHKFCSWHARSIANWNILVCCISFLFLHVALLMYRVVVVVSTQRIGISKRTVLNYKSLETQKIYRQPCRTQPGQRPLAESKEGGAMVETWLEDPGGQQTEMEPMEMETQVEQKSQ